MDSEPVVKCAEMRPITLAEVDGENEDLSCLVRSMAIHSVSLMDVIKQEHKCFKFTLFLSIVFRASMV